MAPAEGRHACCRFPAEEAGARRPFSWAFGKRLFPRCPTDGAGRPDRCSGGCFVRRVEGSLARPAPMRCKAHGMTGEKGRGAYPAADRGRRGATLGFLPRGGLLLWPWGCFFGVRRLLRPELSPGGGGSGENGARRQKKPGAMRPGFKKIWCRGTESNCPHGDFQSPALPTELPRHNEETCIGRGRLWQEEKRGFSHFFHFFSGGSVDAGLCGRLKRPGGHVMHAFFIVVVRFGRGKGGPAIPRGRRLRVRLWRSVQSCSWSGNRRRGRAECPHG